MKANPGSLERVRDYVGKIPYMRYAQAQELRALFERYEIRDCLELGFHHGVSSAYIAAILKEGGGGHLTTIDRLGAREKSPNIEKVLIDLDLREYVTVYHDETSYNWKLMEILENTPDPIYDFCYIDGGHRWEPDGFAFFLVEKLLRSGGWILFDDLDHSFSKTYSERGLLTSTRSRGLMTDRELETQQIRKVWELLVKRHPSFYDFREDGRWGFGRKK